MLKKLFADPLAPLKALTFNHVLVAAITLYGLGLVANMFGVLRPLVMCSRLTDGRFASLPRTNVRSEDIQTWVTWNFLFNRNAPGIQPVYPEPGMESVRWTATDAKMYEVFVNTTTRSVRYYSVNWLAVRNGPEMADVLQCLGAPAAYAAAAVLYATPPHQYIVWLWYPEQQMIVIGQQQADTPNLNKDFGVEEIHFTQLPNTTALSEADQALISALVFGDMHELRPWTGPEAVQFTNVDH